MSMKFHYSGSLQFHLISESFNIYYIYIYIHIYIYTLIFSVNVRNSKYLFTMEINTTFFVNVNLTEFTINGFDRANGQSSNGQKFNWTYLTLLLFLVIFGLVGNAAILAKILKVSVILKTA